MALYTYSFSDKKRDLTDVLSTVIKDEPRFISNFKRVENAVQQKHEWLEDQIAGRAVTASDVTAMLVTASPLMLLNSKLEHCWLSKTIQLYSRLALLTVPPLLPCCSLPTTVQAQLPPLPMIL